MPPVSAQVPAAPPLAPSGKAMADESFPVAWMLPSSMRDAVHAYYAFARAADDIADAPDLSAEAKLAGLEALEQALQTGQGAPVSVTLHAVLRDRALPVSLATDLLRAFRQDATGREYADWPALVAYCDLSAAPVGRFMLALADEHDDAALRAADALCRALQVLNHLQDCGEDMRRLGRCYLPTDWCRQERCDTEALRGTITSPSLRRVLDRMLAATGALLDAAALLPHRLRHRPLRSQAAATLAVARALSRRLAAGDPLAAKIRPRKGDWGQALMVALAWRVRP